MDRYSTLRSRTTALLIEHNELFFVGKTYVKVPTFNSREPSPTAPGSAGRIVFSTTLSKAPVTALLFRKETTTTAQHVELDPLTGALTRQTFFIKLTELSAIANATAQSFCICIIDADQLKNVNEQHGNQAGDEALAQVTRRIRLELAVTLSEAHEVRSRPLRRQRLRVADTRFRC